MMDVSSYKISIIIPVYNTRIYINDCLSSLIQQSHKNIEIILVNDGSTDESGLICDDWEKKDSRIIVRHTENKGVSHARNIGIDIASGDYISFVDSDDWVDTNYYEQLLAAAIECMADACITGHIEDGDRKTYIGIRTKHRIDCNSIEMLTLMADPDRNKTGFFSICAKLWRREMFIGTRLREDISVGEDSLLSWQLMRKANKAVYVPIFGYHYRQRIGSSSHSINVNKALSGIVAFREIYEDARTVSNVLGRGTYIIYLRHLINVSKQILQSGNRDHECELQNMVSEIRSNLWSILNSRNSNWRIRLGSIYLCLPISLCYMLRCFLVETGRNICSK